MLLVLIQANGRFSRDSWHHAEMDSVEYFNLADLWEQYYEWSAYGAGTTVQLYGGERVVQYYVPYLSGIQLYTNKAQTASRSAQKIRSCAWILSLCRFLDALWIGSLSVFFSVGVLVKIMAWTIGAMMRTMRRCQDLGVQHLKTHYLTVMQ